MSCPVSGPHILVYTYIYIYIYTHTHAHIYIYIYTHMYIRTDLHTYMHAYIVERERERAREIYNISTPHDRTHNHLQKDMHTRVSPSDFVHVWNGTPSAETMIIP